MFKLIRYCVCTAVWVLEPFKTYVFLKEKRVCTKEFFFVHLNALVVRNNWTDKFPTRFKYSLPSRSFS